MTNAEKTKLVEDLAGVMGGDKSGEAIILNKKGNWQTLLWWNTTGYWMVGKFFKKDGVQEAIRDVFDPLTDHNHMALVRAKMRDMGYILWIHCFGDLTEVTIWTPSNSMVMMTDPNELIAEALAVKAAVMKEGK